MREELPGAVHTALRKWHTGAQEELPWGRMLTVAQHLAESPVPDHDRAVKEVVLDALHTLEEHSGGDAAQILRIRFLDGYTASAAANRLNLTQDVVYKRQRAAVHDLAEIIWQSELEARLVKEARVVRR
ncbi:hypothetical protein ACFLTC_01360, partial [Chloroflexota bacterium]